MNQLAPEQIRTLNSIKSYLENNSDDNIKNLGMTPDGRIVRLSEHAIDSDECKTLYLTLKKRLLVLQEPHSVLTKPYKTLMDYADRITEKPDTQKQPKNIQLKLDELKQTQKKGFDYLAEKTITRKHPVLKGEITMTTAISGKHSDEVGFGYFFNQFTPDAWFCLSNRKPNNMGKKAFMSQVVINQFEAAFKIMGWPLTYPKTISRCNINNRNTIDVLKKYHERYDTHEFMTAFLKTDNGKSTLWLTKDLGMNIEQLRVTFGPSEEDGKEDEKAKKPADSFSKIDIDALSSDKQYSFTVIMRVSPGAGETR